jgi:ATP-dependent DNA helicase RecG
MLGIKPARFARKIFDILDTGVAEFSEYLPDDILDRYDLPGIKDTIRYSHFPTSLTQAKEGKNRIFFEKLLNIQLVSLQNQLDYQHSTPEEKEIPRDHIKEFLSKLPFELT